MPDQDPFAAYVVQPTAPAADPFAPYVVSSHPAALPTRPVSAEDFTRDAGPQGSAVGRFFSGVGEMLNPVTVAEGLYTAVRHPVDTVSALASAQVNEGRKALQDARSGHVSEAIGHGAAAVLPVLGPMAASIGEQAGTGDIAGAAGKTIVALAPFAAEALPAAAGMRAPLANANPIAADAVDLALDRNVPVDAGTATGNRFVKAIQHVSDRSLGGSLVASKAAQAQQEGLATLGEQLAAKGYGTSATLEQAGDAIRGAIQQNIADATKTADAGYSALRRLEADPANARPVPMPDGSTQLMPMPVDLRPVKAAAKPLADELMRQGQIAPLMGDKATAARALDKIVNGPDHAPLSAADAALGDLKTFARADDSTLRSAGQGKIAATVKQLHASVDAEAARVGRSAETALRTGREATKAKYVSNDVLDSLHAEPVKTVQRLTAPKDSAIDQLRAVQKQAPQAMPVIGRAYLDDMLSKATAEGGFGHGQALAAQWEKLGAQTKLALYRDPGYIRDLDRFFNLAKMSAESANPSGTAHTALAAVQGGWLFTNPITGVPVQLGAAMLSKFLHSSSGVRLLAKGMTIPVKNRAAAAAWANDFGNALTSPSGSQTATAPAR